MSLHASIGGRGRRLVLMHGWGLNSRVWESVLPQLQRSFTVVAVDLPGHGASSWPPEFHDADSLAESMAALLEDGDSMLGWSLGALAAMELAARFPGRIRKLALVAATPKFLRSADWPHGVEPDALREMGERLRTDLTGTVRNFLALQVLGDEHAHSTLKTLREKVQAGGAPQPVALAAGLQTLAASDLRARLPLIEAPTLVISGERDRLSHPKAGEKLASALPCGEFQLVPRAAHAPFISQPEAFCRRIEPFFST